MKDSLFPRNPLNFIHLQENILLFQDHLVTATDIFRGESFELQLFERFQSFQSFQKFDLLFRGLEILVLHIECYCECRGTYLSRKFQEPDFQQLRIKICKLNERDQLVLQLDLHIRTNLELPHTLQDPWYHQGPVNLINAGCHQLFFCGIQAKAHTFNTTRNYMLVF